MRGRGDERTSFSREIRRSGFSTFEGRRFGSSRPDEISLGTPVRRTGRTTAQERLVRHGGTMKKSYEKPVILHTEKLEARAAVCTKADEGCAPGPIQS